MTRQPLTRTNPMNDTRHKQGFTPVAAPVNPLPFPVQELHVTAKLNNNAFFTAYSYMTEYGPSFEKICRAVTNHSCNSLKIGPNDPMRADMFEAACRAAVTLIAGMMGATAYLVFSDEQPDETAAPEMGQGQREAVHAA